MKLDRVLFFPVTPFTSTGTVATDVLDEHLDRGLAFDPGGVFVACGTGEYHALSPDELSAVIEIGVKRVGGRVPVIAGSGGTLPQAVDAARRAADAGADGLLVLPPYLVAGPPEGVVRYVEAIADATDLPLIVYQRGTARLTPDTAVHLARHPHIVGFKDGLGDLDRLHRIVLAVRAAVGDDVQFFNGLPTAEMTVPAYRGIGVALYSSAVFAFAPEIATAFYRSLYDGDGALAVRLLTDFYQPLVELRDQVPGYAVSLVKTGVRLRGLEVGAVRPPLVDTSAEHTTALEAILHRGLDLVDGR